MAIVMDCGLVVSEFELQSCYYVHFRTNTFGKGMNFFVPQAMGWTVSVRFFNKDDFGIKSPTKADMTLNKITVKDPVKESQNKLTVSPPEEYETPTP